MNDYKSPLKSSAWVSGVVMFITLILGLFGVSSISPEEITTFINDGYALYLLGAGVVGQAINIYGTMTRKTRLKFGDKAGH